MWILDTAKSIPPLEKGQWFVQDLQINGVHLLSQWVNERVKNMISNIQVASLDHDGALRWQPLANMATIEIKTTINITLRRKGNKCTP